ncbi:tRNA (N(6)-L-threonylcarbamoyladenosine(37)-C(2))-methylthiotransferase [Candidatus Micrarchaeota archaeon]|nr:tRNA (N(6)-L-threonylcarbamoyladenosine(37)-C(2))-methylthiotransferase [Candidatus Micrarchaeota archaeon]
MRISIETYGCTFNQADSDAIAHALSKAGNRVTSEANAQLAVLNTCGVKNATENRVLNRLRQLAEKGKKTLVTGCLAQAAPERVLAANPSASIVGTFGQNKITDAVKAIANGKRVEWLSRGGFLEPSAAVDGVIARIQVARGCLGTCSFCQTKLARGGLESIPPKTILRLCEQAIASGAKELRLTAQDTGCYGFDAGTNLAELLGEVTQLPGRFRVRVGMANPEHCLKIMPALLKAFESEKVYKFLHVPLQSGSDGVLKAMRRTHSAKDFERAVSLFRKKFPDAMIATDAIAGFPTESETDFEKTIKAIESAQPDFANVSRYSPRPKTAAAAMKQLPDKTVGERTRKLSALCRKIVVEKNRERVGTKGIALVTERAKNGWLARFENYVPIILDEGKLGEFVEVRVKSAGNVACRGERI